MKQVIQEIDEELRFVPFLHPLRFLDVGQVFFSLAHTIVLVVPAAVPEDSHLIF